MFTFRFTNVENCNKIMASQRHPCLILLLGTCDYGILSGRNRPGRFDSVKGEMTRDDPYGLCLTTKAPKGNRRQRERWWQKQDRVEERSEESTRAALKLEEGHRQGMGQPLTGAEDRTQIVPCDLPKECRLPTWSPKDPLQTPEPHECEIINMCCFKH